MKTRVHHDKRRASSRLTELGESASLPVRWKRFSRDVGASCSPGLDGELRYMFLERRLSLDTSRRSTLQRSKKKKSPCPSPLFRLGRASDGNFFFFVLCSFVSPALERHIARPRNCTHPHSPLHLDSVCVCKLKVLFSVFSVFSFSLC